MTAKTGAQHLHEMHLTAAEHHDALAKTKKNQATLFRAMVKEAGMNADGQSSRGKMANELDQEASLHEEYAAHHRDAAAKCEKAEADAMAKANRIEPTQVMAKNPTPHQRVTPVPRAGSPSLQSIDPALAKIVGLSATDQHEDEESLLQ